MLKFLKTDHLKTDWMDRAVKEQRWVDMGEWSFKDGSLNDLSRQSQVHNIVIFIAFLYHLHKKVHVRIYNISTEPRQRIERIPLVANFKEQ